MAIETVGATGGDPSYSGDGHVTTLRLQQPLWTGGKLTAGMEKAEAGVTASRASLEEVRQQLALRVVQTYGDWLAAHLKTQAYDKSMAAHVRLREQVKRRIEQGASADSDQMLAVGRLESVAADISMVRAQKDTALARLGQLLGRAVDDAEFSATLAAPHPVKPGIQTQIDLALAANPTIQKARAQARTQEAVIAERRADLSPEVYLRAEQQYGNYSIRNAASESRLFIGANSRFGAGFSSLSNIEGARAQYQAALAEVEAQSRTISEQILVDHAQATLLEGRLTALRASLEAAGQVSESYSRQFLAGRKSWLDVMNATRELAQAEVQLAEAQASQVAVTWRLAIYSDSLAVVIGGER